MEYNTSRERLLLPEYGRNIQKMVQYCMSIEDREKRSVIARSIIAVMGQLAPHLRDYSDFQHKLWDHLYAISDFKLDVDSPYTMPDRETLERRPDRVSYPNQKIRFKHYGKNIEKFIEKAIAMEDGPGKQAMIHAIANLMKRSYLLWNRDTVNDEAIHDHLAMMSENLLKCEPGFQLISTNEVIGSQKQNQNKGTKKKKKRKKY